MEEQLKIILHPDLISRSKTSDANLRKWQKKKRESENASKDESIWMIIKEIRVTLQLMRGAKNEFAASEGMCVWAHARKAS